MESRLTFFEMKDGCIPFCCYHYEKYDKHCKAREKLHGYKKAINELKQLRRYSP